MKKREDSGFALIAALLTIWILTAVGMLIFTLTTQDVRISSRMVGEKKAFFATEAGVHRLVQGFNPLQLSDPDKYGIYRRVDLDPEGDRDSWYKIDPPGVPIRGPGAVPLSGYTVGGGQQWGATRYVAPVTGKNDRYRSRVQVDTGVGFGPVEITTAYR